MLISWKLYNYIVSSLLLLSLFIHGLPSTLFSFRSTLFSYSSNIPNWLSLVQSSIWSSHKELWFHRLSLYSFSHRVEKGTGNYLKFIMIHFSLYLTLIIPKWYNTAYYSTYEAEFLPILFSLILSYTS